MRQIRAAIADQRGPEAKGIVETRGAVGHAPSNAEARRIELARAPPRLRPRFESFAESRCFEATVAVLGHVLFGRVGTFEGRFAASASSSAGAVRARVAAASGHAAGPARPRSVGPRLLL